MTPQEPFRVLLPPSLYEQARAAGHDMSFYSEAQPIPIDESYFMTAHDHVRVFWAHVFKPFWMLKALIMVNLDPRCTGYFTTWQYCQGLWEIAIDDVAFGLNLMSPAEALGEDAQYWDGE